VLTMVELLQQLRHLTSSGSASPDGENGDKNGPCS